MGPIERVRARAEAFELLGVNKGSTDEDIRAAWRRVAFEMHPDRHGGEQSLFIRARAAYDFLCSDEGYAYSQGAIARSAEAARRMPERQEAVAPRPRRTMPRPVARLTTRALGEDVVASCRALLGAGGGAASPACAAHLRLQSDAPVTDGKVRTDHVPDVIERQGRRITYVVSSPLEPGLNVLALPTALLEGARDVRPALIAISTTEAKSGELTIPEATRRRLFPGARDVRIRFGAVVPVDAAA